ncbi:DNA repair protein recO [Spiroplasma kunkelii CR2-3x]|uniref:DNA repair protein recO n=1 Tax=Spiroplasma kunkelii CR2-3x TaxID=273035 RepID=A0A0K2JH40_SPIKU|nr:DNA repair protein recO [Spiroplasma kunkelii CR2-3x]
MCKGCGSKQHIKTISFLEEWYLCKNCLLPRDYLFPIELVKVFNSNFHTNFYFYNINIKALIILFKMLCDYFLIKVGIFSCSIYEMLQKSIYFKE